VYALACLSVAGGALLLALTRSVPVCAAALVLAGAAWITGLGLLGGGYQSQLPAWVKARAYAYYLLAFQGATGIGSLCLGVVSQTWGVVTALIVVAIGLGASAALTWWLPLPGAAENSPTTAEPLPLPDNDFENDGQPILVIVEYAVRPEATAAFLAIAPELRRMRRRTGAINWYIHRDIDDSDVYIETFLSGSWEEHARQHARVQHADQELLKRVDAMLIPERPRAARHTQSVHIGRRAHPQK
jgi:quinol monooxygenase YgiN